MVLPYSFRDRSSMAVLSTAWLLLICALSCRASYTFFQTYHSYSNPSHARADGRCCDEPGTPPCSTECDNRFTLCVRHAGQPLPENVESLQETDCPLGFLISRVFGNSDSIAFNTSIPVEFTGDIWPTAFQLLVSVEDGDSGSNDDFVDVVEVEMSLSPSPSPTDPTEYLSRDGVCSFTISFRVECSEGLFGEDCSVSCEPRNDSLGHFTCGSGGERVCLDGYRDPETNCTECVPALGCSEANGYCEEPGECLCRDNYGGDLCTQDLTLQDSGGPRDSGGQSTTAIAVGVVLSVLTVVLVAVLILLLLWNWRHVRKMLSEQKNKLLSVSPSPTVPGDNPVYMSVSDVRGELQQSNEIPCDYLQFKPTAPQPDLSQERLFDNPIYSHISEQPRTVGTATQRFSVIDPYGNYGDATIAKVARAAPTSSSSSHTSDARDQLFDDENYAECIQKTASDNDDSD